MTTAEASGSAQILNSAEGVMLDLLIAPPMMTSSETLCANAGSSAIAAARLDSGPTATSTISPGRSPKVRARNSGADSGCFTERAAGNLVEFGFAVFGFHLGGVPRHERVLTCMGACFVGLAVLGQVAQAVEVGAQVAGRGGDIDFQVRVETQHAAKVLKR